MAESESKNRDENGCFAKGNDAGRKTQFKPGQSGNPAGVPRSKTMLWQYFCKYLDMTDSQFDKLKSKKTLKQAQQAAIKMVEDFKSGDVSGNIKLAKYAVDRDLGKALETVKVSGVEPFSDEECENIREIMKRNVE